MDLGRTREGVHSTFSNVEQIHNLTFSLTPSVGQGPKPPSLVKADSDTMLNGSK